MQYPGWQRRQQRALASDPCGSGTGRHLPAPNCPEFENAAAEAIKKYLIQSDGRAFVLFTSYKMLKNIANDLQYFFYENDINLLCQGAGEDRARLLEKFKKDHHRFPEKPSQMMRLVGHVEILPRSEGRNQKTQVLALKISNRLQLWKEKSLSPWV